MDKALEELRAIVMRAGDTWTSTGIPRVEMVRAEACSNQVYAPMLHLVLQGTKELSVGEQVLSLAPPPISSCPLMSLQSGRSRQKNPEAPTLP